MLRQPLASSAAASSKSAGATAAGRSVRGKDWPICLETQVRIAEGRKEGTQNYGAAKKGFAEEERQFLISAVSPMRCHSHTTHPVNVSVAAAAAPAASVRRNKVVTALSDQIRTALKIPLTIKICPDGQRLAALRVTILEGDTRETEGDF